MKADIFQRVMMCSVFALALLMTVPMNVAQADNFGGVWRSQNGEVDVEMYPCGANWCGRIVRISSGQTKDVRNPDRSKRDRNLIGLTILRGTGPTGRPSEYGGTLYQTSNGRTYNGTVTLVSNTQMRLRGCVLGFCRSQTWTRIR